MFLRDTHSFCHKQGVRARPRRGLILITPDQETERNAVWGCEARQKTLAARQARATEKMFARRETGMTTGDEDGMSFPTF